MRKLLWFIAILVTAGCATFAVCVDIVAIPGIARDNGVPGAVAAYMIILIFNIVCVVIPAGWWWFLRQW